MNFANIITIGRLLFTPIIIWLIFSSYYSFGLIFFVLSGLSDALDGFIAKQFNQSTILGHPKGLFILFFTELWERFSFYGMRAILVLYLTAETTDKFNPGLGWTSKEALALYGWYGMFVYFTGIFGGAIVKHLYHGSRENRQYVDRHELLNVDKDIKDLLNISKDGLFEWKFSEFNFKFLNYFISRKDDEDDDIIHVKIINETS